MEGFLLKKGGSGAGVNGRLWRFHRRNWTRRWFQLEGQYLSYFADFDPVANTVVGAAKGGQIIDVSARRVPLLGVIHLAGCTAYVAHRFLRRRGSSSQLRVARSRQKGRPSLSPATT